MIVDPLPVMAGPFTREDFEKLVPADKKLSAEWVRSLTERGSRTIYSGPDLEKIGMPIGGICAGQLYLGGDGRLWHWDIFNQRISTGADHYANPLKPVSPLEQGFALLVTTGETSDVRALASSSWRDITFNGEYPLAEINYSDPSCPVAVRLEAFSPFIPLNTDDSSLPATVLEFTVRNTGSTSVEVELAGWLENAVCLHSAAARDGSRRNRIIRRKDALLVECSAEEPMAKPHSQRADITFDDFERETYGDWVATGTAFGEGPVEMAKAPEYQGPLNGHGRRVVNSHASADGKTVEERDAARGTLTSRPFTIERDYITFLIGGGAQKGKTCLDLVVDGKTVLSATGRNENRMRPATWDVRRWAGRTARLRLVDDEPGPWGNIGLDDIVFTDMPRQPVQSLGQEPDFGTFALALLNPGARDSATTSLPALEVPSGLFTKQPRPSNPVQRPFGQRLAGAVTRSLKLKPGASAKATFVLAWHMPNLRMDRLPPGRYYAERFQSATQVANYIAREYPRLSSQTRLWHDTWYDSTLPYWFLDRTFLNTSILATSTAYRFGNGRFYGWEGVGCCEGTCGHVWQYAHAVARLFPELERTTRENVDLGLALQPNGAIHFRGEFNDIPAIDAQAGVILRVLREHQCSADDSFLKRNWPRVKKALDWLIEKDANGDGLIEGNQHNTLDTDWFGPVAWLSGLYLASLAAAEVMARELGDSAYAEKCAAILEAGRKNILRLFDGDYFINQPDPKHLDAINSGTGCHIDQVFGQSWAFQVHLPRVLPEEQTRTALKSLWRYNFTPDVGPYRNAYRPGRWYAMPGEAGLLMCTFPRKDWDYAQAKGKGPEWAAGYLNECMNGFEYQVAGHMLWEGMLTEGLAITRAIHDRYHPSRRNPWNEVECGDHYARSMASYGVYLATGGFSYHGPRGHLGFAPRINPSNFRCAFTTAQGWGTFQQRFEPRLQAELVLKWGTLRLSRLELNAESGATIEVRLRDRVLRFQSSRVEGKLRIDFETPIQLGAGEVLSIRS